MERDEVVQYLDTLLEAGQFKDYCPNGLQVEGCRDVKRIVAGVTASQQLIDAAIERGADALLVHHGWFWRNENGRITGFRKKRMQSLLQHDINLIAYHLPLDAHPEFGNNAQLAHHLGWIAEMQFGEQNIGWAGHVEHPGTLGALRQTVTEVLKRPPLCIGEDTKQVRRIAWCSGGGQSYFEQAVSLGVDAYFSGEISEQAVHLARESGVAFIAAGHHATERFGVQALSRHIGQKFGLQCEFVDIDNPV